jgi:hypothetical protein
MYLSVGGMSVEFVEIPGKAVEFEDGRTVNVDPFAISRGCVTVGMYRGFQEATQYVTVSERRDGKLYYENELIEHLSPDERMNECASCMSFVDATYFCEWGGVRLPTEAEWLAASLIDERIYDIDAGEECPWYDRVTKRICVNCERALFPSGQWELTASREREPPLRGVQLRIRRIQEHFGLRPPAVVGDDRESIVVHGGPWFFRQANWRSDPNRCLYRDNESGLLVCFRICGKSI